MKRLLLLITIATMILFSGGQVSASQKAIPGYMVLDADEESLVIEFNAPVYDIVQVEYAGITYNQFEITGADYLSEPGKPRLPVLHALIGIPADAYVELRILADQYRVLPGPYKPLPGLEPKPLEGDLQPGKWSLRESEQLEITEPIFPSASVRVGDIAWLRDQRLARIDFYPLQYHYQSMDFTWHTRLRLQIRFIHRKEIRGEGMAPLANKNHSTLVNEALLKRTLANYTQAVKWRANPLAIDSRESADTLGSDLPGNQFKIAINQDDIYRLRYSELLAAGVPVDDVDPTTFKMTNQGEEIRIYVENNDGDEHTFSSSESIVFYGQKFYGDRLASLYADEDRHWLTYTRHFSDGTYGDWSPQFNAKMLEKYTDTNVYWLSYGDGIGLRMGEVNAAPGQAPVVNSYTETIHFEQNINWRTTTFTGEDTWFGDLVSVNTSTPMSWRNYDVLLTSLASGTYSGTLRGELVAITYHAAPLPDHHTQFYLNDPGRSAPIIDATWSGKSRYHFEAQIPQGLLSEGQNRLEFVVQLLSSDQNEMLSDQIYFDWFELDYQRALNAQNNQLVFSLQPASPVLVEMGGFTTDELMILDVSEPLNPINLVNHALVGDKIRFQVESGAGARFRAGEVLEISASGIEAYAPPDFSGPADYILITHRDLNAGVVPLVNFRQSQGLTTLVVDIEDLYNQFNYGIYHPIAIKNFLRYTFTYWDYPPDYVLLVGDGHWNFKGYSTYNSPPIFIPPNLAWVDPWQGEVDSANLLATVVGDDPLPDVHIARLPVNSLSELNSAINKILQYEQGAVQNWQKRLLFIADNVPDPAGDFVALTESVIANQVPPGYQVERIYQNDFGCTQPPCPLVNDAIVNEMNNDGALLVNYVGHAALNRWSGERIFTNADIERLTNANQFPIILSMTCLDGYWIHPGAGGNAAHSLIEEIIRANGKGAVGAFSPTGLGVSTGHDALHRGFYIGLFQDGARELGAAGLAAKLELYASGRHFDLLHTFTVFGDPAMRIVLPQQVTIPLVIR